MKKYYIYIPVIILVFVILALVLYIISSKVALDNASLDIYFSNVKDLALIISPLLIVVFNLIFNVKTNKENNENRVKLLEIEASNNLALQRDNNMSVRGLEIDTHKMKSEEETIKHRKDNLRILYMDIVEKAPEKYIYNKDATADAELNKNHQRLLKMNHYLKITYGKFLQYYVLEKKFDDLVHNTITSTTSCCNNMSSETDTGKRLDLNEQGFELIKKIYHRILMVMQSKIQKELCYLNGGSEKEED